MRKVMRPPLRRGRRGRRRGMAMALAMLVLMGVLALMLLGTISSGTGGAAPAGRSGVMAVADGGRQMAGARMQSAAAFALAEMGSEYTLQWLNSLPAPPAATKPFAPSFTWSDPTPPATATLDAQNRIVRRVVTPDPAVYPGGTFGVVIYPDMGNAGSTIKKYLIESVGSGGGVPVVLQTFVREASFGKYAIFINDTPATSYWASVSNVFDGPVHSNNQVSASNGQANLNNVLWNDGSASNQPVTPIFTWQGPDAFTVSGASVNWWRNSAFNTSGPNSETEWKDILSVGSSGFHTNDAVIPFPPDSGYSGQHGGQSRQHDVALGNNPPPAVSGVTAEPGGGIYVHCASTANDVQQMTLGKFSSFGTTYQTVDVTQTADDGHTALESVVYIDPSHNAYTEVYRNGYYVSGPTYAGSGFNGVVYCDGNIGTQGTPQAGGLAGQVCDHTALTVATDPAKNCNIDGDLKYATARQTQGGSPIPEAQDANFVNNAGTLGVVSNNVRVMDYYGSNDWEGNAAGAKITNVEVDAAVMAYGTYDAQDYTTRTLGKMLNMGSYLVKTRGIFSYSNLASGAAVAGIPCDRRYDNRLANAPPPSFPTTGNLYDVLSWRRVAQTLLP